MEKVTSLPTVDVERPVLDLSGEALRAGLQVMVAGSEENGGIERYVDAEISIGDYVISGGELAAMVVIDSLLRLLPGALGHVDSAEQDSFSAGLLDCPHYTRPEHYQGQQVPEVLLSGNHERIRQWRLQQSLIRTWQRRPELLDQLSLSEEQQTLLSQYLSTQQVEDT